MNILFFVNGLVMLAISFVIIFSFFKYRSLHNVTKVTSRLSIISLLYIVPVVLSFFWFFGFLEYEPTDFLLIYSSLLFFQTFVLFYSFRFLLRDKGIVYLLFSYLLTVFAVFISFKIFLIAVSIFSFFLTIILFVLFSYEAPKFGKAARYGIAYSGISVIANIILIFGVQNYYLFSTISNGLFLVFLFYFLRDIRQYPFNFLRSLAKERSYLSLFIDYFTFVFVLTTLVLMATVGVHEMGHVLASNYFGCDSRTILFEDGQYPYTEILCPDGSMKIYSLLAGPVLPVIIALALLVFGGKFTKEAGILMIGFDFLASYKDFLELGVSMSLVVASVVIGMIFLFLGIILISKNRMENAIPY